MISILKQAVALVLEGKDDDDPKLMVYGKGAMW